MIHIKGNKHIKTLLYNGNIIETHVTWYKRITVFGKQIWRRDFDTNVDVSQGVIPVVKIGFDTNKKDVNEKDTK